MKFDTFYATVNDWGYYQKIKFFIICLANMVPPLIFYTWSFTAATPDFRCSLPLESDAYNSQMNHLYDTTYKPTIDDCATHQKLLSLKECQRCFIRIATHNTTSISKLHKCQDYVFDRSIYKKTLVEEWTMVCDRVLYRTAVQVAYFIGVMVGAVFFGSMADKFGRRPIMSICFVILAIVSFISTFCPQDVFGTGYSHLFFLIARFLLACSTRGISESGFVLSSELVSPRKRVMAGAVMTYFYAFGQLWLVLFAYFIRTWRMLLLTTSFLMLPYCLFYLFLPESPRWLISKGRFSEAEKVLRTIAIENKQKFSHEAYEQFKATQNRDRHGTVPHAGISSLFRFKITAFITLNLFFQWFAQNIVYYGVSQSTGSWQVDPYLSFCISAAVELPAFMVIQLLLDRVGRKIPYCSFAASFGIIAMLVLPVQTYMGAYKDAQRIIVFIINILLKFCGSLTFLIIYILTTELLPTNTRTTGMGYSSMIGRLGAIMGTFCNDYLTRIWSNFPIVLYGVISLIAAGLAITFPETLNRPLPQTSEEVHRMGLAFGLLSDNKSKNKYDDDDDEPAAQILTINEDNEKQKSVENINGKP
ncbi:unnamed protein product [Rotaria sordida]|uniref:Major facilitator superfamily (MFS) profile domain-containing protein n=1 Tax=Rotaria sordida TaxID=392033 RepID=A0A815VLC2_9BILA|nr:unnamed protein product [Rotaria sordida]CAF1530380.1 unnamed protein product [Rotaria sordida]